MENRKERVLALVEEGYSARQAAERSGVPSRTAQNWVRRYRETGETARKRGSGRRRITTAEQDRSLVAEAQRRPHSTCRTLRQAAEFSASRTTAVRRLREANLFARRAAVKEHLSAVHIQRRLSFAEQNVNRDWTNVVFSDECTFCSSNDGPVVVYRQRGARYNPRYVFHKHSSGRVSVSAWGWMSFNKLGSLHRIEGRLTGEQYLQILRDVMLPSVRLLHPHGDIQFQHDRSPIHMSRVVQSWIASQSHIQVLDWPPRGADMNPIENVWSEVKRIMRDKWPTPPPTTRNALWELVLQAWEEVSESERYIRQLTGSMQRRMRAVIEARGHWTSY